MEEARLAGIQGKTDEHLLERLRVRELRLHQYLYTHNNSFAAMLEVPTITSAKMGQFPYE